MTYPGGKNGAGVYHAIINQMPPHRVYIESFLGGGAILLHKRPAHTSWACEWNLEQFAGFTPTLDSDHFGLGVDDDGQRIFRDRDGIPNLFLRHVDALKFLREFSFQGERDHYLVYMDPPYLKEVRSTGARIYTKDFSTWFEHEELLALAVSLNANVMISGYDHPVYNERLAGWRKIEFTGPTRGGARTECLWMNFAEPVELHDYRYIGENYIVRETIRRQQKRWIKNLEAMPPLQRNALISLIGETFAPSRVAVAAENGGAIVAPGLEPSGQAVDVAAPGRTRQAAPIPTSTTDISDEAREIDAAGYLGRDHDQHPTRNPDVPDATAINDGAGAFVDPRSLSCPTCQAQPGKPCKRPSGHTVFGGGFHATRVPADTVTNAGAAGKKTNGDFAVAILVDRYFHEGEIADALKSKDAVEYLRKRAVDAQRCWADGDSRVLTVPGCKVQIELRRGKRWTVPMSMDLRKLARKVVEKNGLDLTAKNGDAGSRKRRVNA